MKDPKDPGTGELIEEAPYLVISTTKKGFREFKMASWYQGMDRLERGNWCWDKHLKHAQRFQLERLPELIEGVKDRRAVTVGLVKNGTLHVLGVTRYPM
jgi:hypothetical protein